MRLFYYLVCILFESCFALNIFAQKPVTHDHYADSLESLLQKATSDTAKTEILNQLSDYYSNTDSAKAIQYALQSLNNSKGNNYYTALAHFYIGGVYFDSNPNESAKEYLSAIELLKADTSLRALQYKARAWHNYGAIRQKKNDSKDFADILLNKVIPLSIQIKDTSHLALNYHDLGIVFMNLDDFKKAMFYYKKAVELTSGKKRYSQELATVYLDMAKTYIYEKKFAEAKPLIDSVQGLLLPSGKPFLKLDYFIINGTYHYHIHQWGPAFKYLDTALIIAKQLHSIYDVGRITFEKYYAYKEKQDYASAKKELLKTFDLLKIIPNDVNRLLLLYEMAQNEASLGNMKNAFDWMNRYASFADSVYEKKSKTNIAELEIKYNAEKGQKEILSLQNKTKTQELILQNEKFVRYLLIAAFAFATLLLVFLLFLYRNKKRAIEQQNNVYRQKLKDIEQQQKLNVYNAILEGQELERQRISRDLHDGLGGLLAGAKIKLSDIVEKNKTNTDMELHKVINQLDNSVEELRRIARNMMPETLIRYGLETALLDLCNSLQSDNTKIYLEVFELDKNITQPVQITIYRIVQELLTNALKHSEADKIIVQCSQNENMVFITVEDNGKGFNTQNLAGKKGIGIENIRNRVSLLKGKTDIQSTPGEGTTVNIEVHATV